MDDAYGWGSIILSALVVGITGLFVSFMITRSELSFFKAQAVELNHAHYTNDVYGVSYFTWNDCCTTNK